MNSHPPADAHEAGFVAAMQAVLDASDDGAFGRSHFEPGHFTASSFVIAPDRQRILLILHSKFGIWLQPGGHVDPEDVDIAAAARREVAEETGLGSTDIELSELFDGLLDVDIHDIPANPRKGEPPHQHLDVRFCFQATTDRIAAGSDASDARWVSLDEADAIETDESVRRALRKLRAALAR
ncbi:MAG: NUDIX domain-containing protein [Proteobacteria bacterium]|nr:NUDIX domain-containing protein [Pseudomonadota bacterium]